MQPLIKAFFHQPTFTLTYVVSCPDTKKCIVIDPVLDFDIFSGTIDSNTIEQVADYIRAQQLSLEWTLETHAHADHITAATYLKNQFNCLIGCSSEIKSIQREFKTLFNLDDFIADGAQFDKLFKHGDNFILGNISVKVVSTPGHTADSLTYVIGKHAFVGDTLFMPDSGSARCDFPGGCARQLYQSIQSIYALGNETELYMCHDYQPNGRELKYKCTVYEQKKDNIHINQYVSEEDYVKTRQTRDAGLSVPRLIYPSLQMNIKAGQLPQAESNEQHYLKVPLNVSQSATKALIGYE